MSKGWIKASKGPHLALGPQFGDPCFRDAKGEAPDIMRKVLMHASGAFQRLNMSRDCQPIAGDFCLTYPLQPAVLFTMAVIGSDWES